MNEFMRLRSLIIDQLMYSPGNITPEIDLVIATYMVAYLKFKEGG